MLRLARRQLGGTCRLPPLLLPHSFHRLSSQRPLAARRANGRQALLKSSLHLLQHLQRRNRGIWRKAGSLVSGGQVLRQCCGCACCALHCLRWSRCIRLLSLNWSTTATAAAPAAAGWGSVAAQQRSSALQVLLLGCPQRSAARPAGCDGALQLLNLPPQRLSLAIQARLCQRRQGRGYCTAWGVVRDVTLTPSQNLI